MSSDCLSWTGTVIQTVREENHISLAIDVNELPLHWGERLSVDADGVSAEAFFHGSMKTWSVHARIFGHAAASALAADSGIDAYVEGDRTMGGRKISGYTTWLRLRAALGGSSGSRSLFQLPLGASVTLRRSEAPVVPFFHHSTILAIHFFLYRKE